MKINDWLSLAGYIFITGVSVVGALRIEGTVWRVLLIMSAAVSLILAISRMQKNKRMAKKIQTLEENQLSVRCEEEKEMLCFEKGVK